MIPNFVEILYYNSSKCGLSSHFMSKSRLIKNKRVKNITYNKSVFYGPSDQMGEKKPHRRIGSFRTIPTAKFSKTSSSSCYNLIYIRANIESKLKNTSYIVFLRQFWRNNYLIVRKTLESHCFIVKCHMCFMWNAYKLWPTVIFRNKTPNRRLCPKRVLFPHFPQHIT